MLRVFPVMILILSVTTLCVTTCYADTNWSGFHTCNWRYSNATSDTLKTNVNTTLSILEEKGPQHGFYKTSVGKGSEKVYGLVQCSGDVSAQDCSQCIKNATQAALSECNYSFYFSKWYRWCYVSYYYDMKNFWDWEAMSLSTSRGNGTDKPGVVSAGINLILKLANEAPEQPRLFKTATVDVGTEGKRYGSAQCVGDLGKNECRKCLTAQARVFDSNISNQSSLVVASHGCIFWYDDYQFYFNYTAPTDGYSDSPVTGTSTITLVAMSFIYFVFML